MKAKKTKGLPLKIVCGFLAVVLVVGCCLSFGGYTSSAFADEVTTAGVDTDEPNTEVVADVSEYGTYEDAVVEVRAQLRDRAIGPFSVRYVSDSQYSAGTFLSDVYEHTGNPVEGDYLRFCACPTINVVSESEDGSGSYYTELLVEPSYVGFTDNPYAPEDAAAVEAWATEKCEEILTSLNLDSMSMWDRASAIYEYIRCEMQYDWDNVDNYTDYAISWTPYGALINGNAVCQGFSTLYYRLMLMAGIDCRVIVGNYGSSAHAWNIVGMDDGYYYLCDVTGDMSSIGHQLRRSHFLRGTEDFNDGLHAVGNNYEPSSMYTTDEWNATYPVPETRYNDYNWRAFIQFGSENYTYTGSEIKPVVSVQDHVGNILVEGVDYTLTYTDNIEVGTATITVSGIGEYAGYPEIVLTFEIVEKGSSTPDLTYISLENADVSGIESWYFDSGSSHIADKPTVSVDGNVLVEGCDYTLEYVGGDVVGTGVIYIIGSAESGKYNSDNIAYTGVVSVTYKVINRYADVDLEYARNSYEKMWYFDAVYSLRAADVMTGYADNNFGLGDVITRADFVTTLWRYYDADAYAEYNEPDAVNTTGLPDVDDGAYWTGAANWAVDEGIVTGKQLADGSYEFDPYASISFEDAVTIIARYALGADEAANFDDSVLNDNKFVDGDTVSAYARGSVSWAIECGVVSGNDNGDGTYTIAPLDDVARERVATVLWRGIESSLI